MREELDALRRRFVGHEPGLLGARREFAVLCPLVETEEGLSLLFEVRAKDIRQGGEVCFPGGMRENGESVAECALRETEEELSIPRRTVSLLGYPDFICNQRGFLLRPVLGLVSHEGVAMINPAPAEVTEVFTVPLSFLRNTPPRMYSYTLIPQVPEDFPYASVGVSPDYAWARGRVEIPVWDWKGHPIWGMTARITLSLLTETHG